MRQKKLFIRIPLFIIFIGIIGSTIFNKFFKTDFNSLNDLDRNMINQLSEVYQTYDKYTKDIWTEDYDFNNLPLILTPVDKDKGIFHTHSYAIGVDSLENSIFSKEIEIPDEINLPPIYRVSFLSLSLISTWLPANFIFLDLGSQHATFFKYHPLNITPANTEQSFKYFLMHEVFHEYRQVPLWENVNDLTSSIFIEERNKEQYQLLLLEFSLLDKANSTDNEDQLINVLSNYVEVREYRYSKFPFMKQEKLVETLEGSAQYIEYKYSNIVGDLVKPPFTVNGKVIEFKEVFSKESLENFVKESDLHAFMDKDLYYYVGSLEGILMDKLGINWIERVENNELIYDILKDEIYKQTTNQADNIEEIKNNYNYNDFNDEATIILNNLNE